MPANTGNYYHKDEDGNFWNVMVYINDSVTHNVVEKDEIAYEGGKLAGDFLNLTSDFDASVLIDVIPKFHDMSFRFWQFEEALKIASKERLEIAKTYINRVVSLKEEMHII